MARLKHEVVTLAEWKDVVFASAPLFTRNIYLTPKGLHGFYEWIIYSVKVYFGSFNVSRTTAFMSYEFNVDAGVRKTKAFNDPNYTSIAKFRHQVKGEFTSGVDWDNSAFVRDTDQRTIDAQGSRLLAFDYVKGIQGQGGITIWANPGGENNVDEFINAPGINFFIEYDIQSVPFPYDWNNLHYERS